FCLIELARPLALEVDGIDQKQNRLRVDLIDDVIDLTFCLIGDPRVNRSGGTRITEVQGRHLRAEELLIAANELRIEAHSFSCPERIGDVEFNLRIGAFESL